MSVSCPAPLAGLRIVDLTTGLAGPYCSKLLVDAGAEVIKVEPPGGDPMRRWSAFGGPIPGGRDSAFFAFLNAGKQSLVADLSTDPGRRRLLGLLEEADVLLEDLEPGGLEGIGLGSEALGRSTSRLATVSLTTFGADGPWSDRPGDEFVLQALAGSTDARGLPGETPISVGGRLGDVLLGAMAAPLAVAAARLAVERRGPVRIEVSQYEAMMHAFQTYRTIQAVFDPGENLARSIDLPSIEPAADGWVGFCPITGQQFRDFVTLVGDPGLGGEEFSTSEKRMERREEFSDRVQAYTGVRTVEEIVEAANALRIPCVPVGHGRSVLGFDHLLERKVFRDHPEGFTAPRPPILYDDHDPGPPRPAPALDQHHGWAGERTEPESTGRQLPLEGVRILDFTAFWAGPFATNLLRLLGAELVKVESVQRPDMMRFSSVAGRSPLWEFSPVFHGSNAGKTAITLRLDDPDGHALAERLVQWADVVVENFSPRVMDQLGLGWDRISELNPSAIMVRMPAFGLDGPWRNRTGFAMTIEQVSGLAWLTGHSNGPPIVPRGVCDPLGGAHAVMGTLCALAQREHTGRGQMVEVPLVEVGLNAAAEQAVEWSANGRLLERAGNRSPASGIRGVYPASEDDSWVAVSIGHDDARWAALCGVLGRPELVADERFATSTARVENHDDVDAVIGQWTSGQSMHEAAEALSGAGIPAAPTVNAYLSGDSPHLEARGYFQSADHPVAGRVPYPSAPFRIDGRYLPLGGPAPTLGQHTEEVLGELLGLDGEAITDLGARQVTGRTPVRGPR